jgi:antitoxin HigA-1
MQRSVIFKFVLANLSWTTSRQQHAPTQTAGSTERPKMSKSATITDEPERLRNPTPGDILLEEFLQPIGMSQNALARAIAVPPRRINEIALGKRSITADTDLRLARYWGVSDGFWLRLQADHDLMLRRRQLGSALDKIAPRAA